MKLTEKENMLLRKRGVSGYDFVPPDRRRGLNGA
jgi:hypothetical protein